jgi:putative transposase
MVIEGLRQEGYPLRFMLDWVKMARSTFYYHIAHAEDNDGYDELRRKIKTKFEVSKRRYGYRRICLQLRGDGYIVNHKTVLKLIKQMGLHPNRKKRHYHSYKGDVGKVAPNILQRDFKAEKPNLKWTTDVTQVNIKDYKVYLSPILDMFNGEIISYTISRSPNLSMVIKMLNKAFSKHKDLDGLIMHSDQGWHYQHARYQKMLLDHNIKQSMSRKGNCLDNAMMENFFGLMKNELLYVNDYESIEDFEKDLRKYIVWYNNKRIKLRLKGMSPVQYRAHYCDL